MSKFKPKFIGEVKNGKLTLENQDDFREHVKSFEGKKIVLEIKRAVKPRSSPQIAYYFAVVVTLVKDALRDLGHEIHLQETHELLKSKFLYKEIVVDGEIINVPLSLSDKEEIDTGRMSEYIDAIKKWASETLNIYIPDPNEYT